MDAKPILAQIKSALTQAAGRNPPFFLLKGEAGIGKSHLLKLLSNDLHGWAIFKIHISEQQPAFLFPWLQIVSAMQEKESTILEKEKDQLNGLATEASDGFLKSATVGYKPSDAWQAGRNKISGEVFNLIFAIFNRFSESRNCLIICEDLHHANSSTIQFLDFLLKSPSEKNFNLVASIREDEISKELSSYIASWSKDHLIKSFTLSGLPEEIAEEIIRDILGADVERKVFIEIIEAAGGNPLFISELTNALKDSGGLKLEDNQWKFNGIQEMPVPRSMQEIVIQKIDKLSIEARRTLEIGACIGDSFPADHLEALTGEPVCIDELLRAGLLIENGVNRLSFRHSLITKSVLPLISWSTRRILFQKVAEFYEQHDSLNFKLGEYWLKGGQPAKAFPHLLRIAGEYCRLHDYRKAIQTATLALQDWSPSFEAQQKFPLLVILGECLKLQDDLQEAIVVYKDCLKLCDETLDNHYKVHFLRSIASVFALQGAWNKFLENRLEAAKLACHLGMYEESANDYFEIANRQVDDLKIHAALETATSAMKCAEKSPNPEINIKAKSLHAYIMAMSGDTGSALLQASDAVKQAEKYHFTEVLAYAYRKLAGVLEYSSDFKQSVSTYSQALNYCRHEKLDKHAYLCLSCMSWVLFRCGDWGQALKVSGELLGDKTINEQSKAAAHMVAGLIRTCRGELKSARMHFLSSKEMALGVNFRLIYFLISWGEAMLAQSLNNEAEAGNHYQQALDTWQQSDESHDILPVLMFAAEYFHTTKNHQSLNEVVRILSELIRKTSNPEALGCFSFAISLSFFKEDLRETVQGFQKAMDCFEKTATPLQKMVTQYYLAQALIQQGQPEAARQQIGEALAQAKHLGMRNYAAQISALNNELLQSTHEIKNPARAFTLTARQLNILQLMAEGLSNKEMASRLHLSVRTVDMHVRNIFDQLYCRNRMEAIKIAREKAIIA